MAKARTYKRDNNGRFSSGGSLAARSSARRSRQKLADATAAGKSAASIRAQKAAVTRTAKAAKAAKVANQRKMVGRRSGTVAKPKNLKPGALQARRAIAAQKRRPPAPLRAITAAAAATFVAGQAARSRLNRALKMGKRKR